MNQSTFLSELMVMDASSVLAGPSVGTFFAELGAKVIKIEHPTLGDVTRSWKLQSEDEKSNISNYFASVNYHKEYLQLNLLLETDGSQFLEMVSKADILITNYKKGDQEKLGISDKILQKMNPRLIHGKITGFGSESDRIAYDLILQAETGFMSMNGQIDSPPTKMPVALIDVLAAHHLKEAILLALLKLNKTGHGSTVEVSLFDAAVSSLMNQASNYLMSGIIAKRIGSLHPNIAPYGEIFYTAENTEMTLAIGSDKHFSLLCEILDLQELTDHSMYHSNQNRVVNRTKLYDLLQERISHWKVSELTSTMHAAGVPCGIIKKINEVFESEKAQNLILTESMSGKETQRIQSCIFKWT